MPLSSILSFKCFHIMNQKIPCGLLCNCLFIQIIFVLCLWFYVTLLIKCLSNYSAYSIFLNKYLLNIVLSIFSNWFPCKVFFWCLFFQWFYFHQDSIDCIILLKVVYLFCSQQFVSRDFWGWFFHILDSRDLCSSVELDKCSCCSGVVMVSTCCEYYD